MKKSLKLLAVMLMAIVVVCTSTPMVFAASGLVDDIKGNISTNSTGASDLTQMAGKVIGLIQMASAVAAVVLIAVFGFKFILGSANEKADYQKSFIPLIVGVVVVFAATSIAKLLFGIITPPETSALLLFRIMA